MSGFRRSHAVTLGIDAYGGGVAELTTAVADARAVGACLDGHGYEVRFLLDAEAGHERLLTLFEEDLPAGVGPDDRHVVPGADARRAGGLPRPGGEGRRKRP